MAAETFANQKIRRHFESGDEMKEFQTEFEITFCSAVGRIARS